jgi:hypothetical protein
MPVTPPGGGGPPVFIPTLAPGLGYGGPAIAATGVVLCKVVTVGVTLTIGTVTLTAVASDPGPFEFIRAPGGTPADDVLTAQNLAAAIDANLAGVVITTPYTSGPDVGVKLTASAKGSAGNTIVFVSSDGITMPVTGQGWLEGGYGEGGAYGYSPYGHASFARHPIPPDGGYGGAAYGYSSYGSVDITPPRMSAAISLDGYRVEVFFNEAMEVDDALCDPANYTLAGIIGAPATVTSVLLGTQGTYGGYTSVILIHTGTTTGGTYTVTGVNMTDIAGNPIGPPPANSAIFLSLGDTATYTVNPVSGTELQFQFYRSDAVTTQSMLSEAGFSPGIEDASNYEITTTYPIGVVIGDITHPGTGGGDTADMEVASMTSAPYATSITPADTIIYDGSILPSASTEFTGTEIGSGTSTASSSTKLLLSKVAGGGYGWRFSDTTGLLLPGSSYRSAFTIDATTAFFAPPLFDTTMGTLVLNDGAVETTFIFTRVAGNDAIDILSGGFSASIPAAWSTVATTIELYRNQKAGHFAVLINGVPVVSTPTASFTGIPTIPVGARFLLASTYAVSTFKLESLEVTSSSTIFTTAWNFLHSVITTFTGSPAQANDRILTERGPLTKGWGDATPATEQDVEVRINGIVVDVDRVNPYIGAIFPAIPIPLTPAGSNTIEVDYEWFPAPQMAMAGLNTPGLILNKFDQPRGHTHPGTNPLPSTSNGAKDTARFPMAVVLPPLERPQPILIGHRYIGYEQGYTASLNSPTTLLLNQSPHRVSVPGIEKDVEGASASFDGTTTPPTAVDEWSLEGTDTGSVVGDGTYRLIDSEAGSFEVGDATVYYRDENLSCPVTVNELARFQVETYTADGIFTGVGFGFHDNFRLYLMGVLVVNGVRHVGLLLDASLPHLEESWEIGPASGGTIIDGTTVTVPASEFPGNINPGDRFQILEGSQAGVYTITACGIDNFDGTVTITIDPDNPFPADPGLEGNDTATLIWETKWDEELLSYRLIVDVDDRQAQLFVGGSLAGQAITLTDPTAIPAETSLLIPTGDKGRLMFGSFSRIAINDTLWSFHRYDVTPDQALVHVKGIVVAAEMSDPPESDANNEWFFTNGFGWSEIDSSGDTLLLKSTSADSSDVLDLSFGYARIEPLLTRKTFLDVDAHFQVDSGMLGAGDAVVRVRDDLREAKLATILYREGGTPYRQLISLPQVSFSGLLLPTSDGWVESNSPTFSLTDVSIRQNLLTINQALGEAGRWRKDIDSSTHDSGGRILDARFRVVSWTANGNGFAGPTFTGTLGLTTGTMYRIILAPKIAIGVNPARIAVLDSSLAEITSFDFDWTDSEFHSFRVVATTAGAVVIADDTVLGTVALTSLSAGANEGRLNFGAAFSDTVSSVEWDSFYGHGLPVAAAKRTIGVYKSGDIDDIDSWVLPRTDGTSAANSTSTALVVEMDWTALMKVRVHLDPTWGVSIYRPDLPPPPGFTGNFATQVTDPTAAWINIEYRRLPKHDDMFGSVAFGALDPRSVTQHRWREVRYRIYNTPSEDFIAPQHMVLNQYNVITSGELLRDITPEVVTVNSLTANIVSIRSAHMNADRVFVVVVDAAVIPPTEWVFDKVSQTITFTNALPSNSYPVTITFAPGKPVTKTYLCAQPLEQSVTLLNEGTPPVPMSQQAVTTAVVVSGSTLNDPNDTLNDDPDFILNDPFTSVQFELGPESLYDCLQFCTVDDGGDNGLLSIACDGPAPESGLIELEMSGRMFNDGFSVPDGPAGPWGSSSPSIQGTASSFDQTHVFTLSGGHYTGPVLGPAPNPTDAPLTVFYPNWPGPNGHQRGQNRGVNQETSLVLQFITPFEDSYVIPPTGDNTPPSLPYIMALNPDGTPGTQLHGAAFAEFIEYAADGVSRLGPWGGLEALSVSSLLGGGAPILPSTFILNGGAALTPPVVTTQVIEAAN